MAFKSTIAALAICAAVVQVASAEGIDDPQRASYGLMKNKTVAYLPQAMGLDLTEGWGAYVKNSAEHLGMKFEMRDPNWNVDAGVQALTALIADHPDILVVHNPDLNSYARLQKKAVEAGIYVIQLNTGSSYPTDALVGTDWVGLGELEANLVVKHCGTGSGRSGKVSIVQGMLTSAASAYQIKGVENVLSQHPDIKVVSNQTADWDATKARAITETVLQQNNDLCGVIGFWDGMDVGIGAAVTQASKTDSVYVVSSGGGAQSSCDNVDKGVFSAFVKYDMRVQGRDISDMMQTLLQSKQKPGALRIVLYTPMQVVTKENNKPGVCWNLDDIKAQAQ
jgi:ABC-type sugar transport system substrate-binding protein